MRASRLLSILIHLQLRGRVTAEWLGEETGVSVRTIYRDIDALSAAGVPVYADRGPGGGFQLLDGYRTRLTGLTEAEAETLLMIGLSVPLADLGLEEQARLMRLKLLAAIDPTRSAAALRIGNRFHLDPHDWYRQEVPPPHLPVIARAVWDGKRVSVRYIRWSGIVDRMIDPLGLILKAGKWYLAGAVGGTVRTYKIEKFIDVETLTDPVERPQDFDLAAYWQRAVDRFEADLRRIEARVRVFPAALDGVDRLGSRNAEIIRRATPDEEGIRDAIIWIENIAHGAEQVMGFGETLVVLAPETLRMAVVERARRVIARYERGQGGTD